MGLVHTKQFRTLSCDGGDSEEPRIEVESVKKNMVKLVANWANWTNHGKKNIRTKLTMLSSSGAESFVDFFSGISY